MGYHIFQDNVGTEFLLSAAKVEEAFNLLKTELRQDQSWNGYFIGWDELREAKNLDEALQATRWLPRFDGSGDVIDIEFTGEKLGGKELEIFKLLAKAGAVGKIPMRGEDGDRWVYVLKDGTAVEVSVPHGPWRY
jgi:hypothetical protein